MIVLEEPYISEPLIAWLEESQHPVLGNEAARAAAQGRSLNLVDEGEAVRRIEAGERLYTNSESALDWVCGHADGTPLAEAIRLFKDKARMRSALAPLDPDLFYKACSIDELLKLDFDSLKTPFVLKPSVGFCSVGVHAVADRDDWERALADVSQNMRTWHERYPSSVVGSGSFLLEGYIGGTEYAVDAYFDEVGAAHVLNVFRHDFSGADDTSDRLYVTSPAVVRENAPLLAAWLDKVNARIGARNFPVHVEVRVSDGHVCPIEFNPLRFAGLGGTDASWYAYGYRTYEAYLAGADPDFDAAFAGKEDKVYAMSLLGMPADAPADARFDHEAFTGRFSHVLSYTPFDTAQTGAFGFLYVESDAADADELRYLQNVDLRDFLRP